jgi:HEAT repeat protein
MTKMFPIVVVFAAAHLQAVPVTTSEPPVTRAWAILEQGVTNKSAAKRANAIHALRLLPDETRARSMAENALADSNPNVRAAAARVLGLMRATSSIRS